MRGRTGTPSAGRPRTPLAPWSWWATASAAAWSPTSSARPPETSHPPWSLQAPSFSVTPCTDPRPRGSPARTAWPRSWSFRRGCAPSLSPGSRTSSSTAAIGAGPRRPWAGLRSRRWWAACTAAPRPGWSWSPGPSTTRSRWPRSTRRRRGSWRATPWTPSSRTCDSSPSTRAWGVGSAPLTLTVGRSQPLASIAREPPLPIDLDSACTSISDLRQAVPVTLRILNGARHIFLKIHE
mmetsp:Transcript_19624/g.65961  ORF Transcript_19624/g.65961 Transcript_19624/m.65961 type:complete len:237 (-) Transcript_19624:11-721(-)